MISRSCFSFNAHYLVDQPAVPEMCVAPADETSTSCASLDFPVLVESLDRQVQRSDPAAREPAVLVLDQVHLGRKMFFFLV